MKTIAVPLALVLTAVIAAPARAVDGGAPRLASLAIPGDAQLVKLARDVVDLAFALDPSLASAAGLFDDAVRVPSYSAANVKQLVRRAEQDLASLRALPWRRWSVDQQIDFRWLFANVETTRHQLVDEKLFVHRPAQWLEPLSNDLINLTSYAPERAELVQRLFALVPAMVDEMRAVAVEPTRRDVETAGDLIDALVTMTRQSKSAEAARAAEALTAYKKELAAQKPTREFAVVGKEHYAWRYQHAMLLPWTPGQLLELAERELHDIDTQLAALKPHLAPPAKPTDKQLAAAGALSRKSLLALYDAVEQANREATIKGDFVSIPDAVGPIAARETPDAMVPLTGDGGSMNPPPTYWASNLGYWNVEHFKAEWPPATRINKVVAAERYRENDLGPYAAHEGFPGHHLQLSIARLHKDPLRSILAEGTLEEGWGLYAEEELWKHGGLGPSVDAHYQTLDSYRFRIARVFYDVNIETGAWDLQNAADFKDRAAAGKGVIDEDVKRAIQWPSQLIDYFAGKMQILALRAEYQKKLGDKYNERAFNDALLAEGSVPIALIRAKLLGEPVPGI